MVNASFLLRARPRAISPRGGEAMSRSYESLYIVHPELNDEQVEAIMEKYKQIMESQGGEVETSVVGISAVWPYEVKGQREGIYILMNFKSR